MLSSNTNGAKCPNVGHFAPFWHETGGNARPPFADRCVLPGGLGAKIGPVVDRVAVDRVNRANARLRADPVGVESALVSR
ncbi:MAG: hypothetical protein KDA99_29470 [Planctomycetales bacterium]|nr:hypothetical protein [Planctomycetales bacterium]